MQIGNNSHACFLLSLYLHINISYCVSTGRCLFTGSQLKLKPFDTNALSDNIIEGACEYNAFEVPDEGFKIKFKAVLCGTSGKIGDFVASFNQSY